MSSLQNAGMTEDTKYSSEQLLLRNNFQSDQPLGSGCYQRNPASSVGHVVSSAWKDLFPLRALPSGWGTPTQPKRLRFQPPSPPTTPALGPNPASKSSSKRPSSWPQPLPPPRWPPHPPPGFAAAVREALGTSQNREQLPTSGCRPPRGSGRTGCGRRGRDYALAFRLPQRAGKLRPRAGGNFSRVHSPGPQASRPPSAIPRPHAPPGRPGEPGEERVSERALRPGPRRAPDAANSPRKLLSPSLPSPLTSETHLLAGPGSRTLTSGPPCAHPSPRSLTAPLPPTPAAGGRSPAPPRALPPAAGARLPRPAARLASAPRPPGLLAPGSPSPGPRPASARPAGGRSQGSRAGGEGLGCAGRGGGARSLTLGCAHARTNSHTDTRGVRCRRPPLLLLPPPP
ncbi:basic proline-rich protein-like [Lynx canadensis]|uniref:basic proline-rich protein-like n=1 Tax=Lynx canadensis TaxID=61383 RepID=UPI0011B0AB82|nr:basic proline-rich protein-like [Lynx canadensis]